MRSASIVQNTASMVPLVNVKSLSQYYSEPELASALASAISIEGFQGKTASMRVLRSMSQFDKDFELVIAKNDGIVTDKHKTHGVQTDIYEDVEDCSSN